MKTAFIAATLLAISVSVSLAATVTYTVDPTHTYASYTVEHLGFSLQSGSFTQVSGKVWLDQEKQQGKVDISIASNSLQTFFPARDKHLKSADFFNVDKYPSIRFQSDQLVFNGTTLRAVKGQLTLLGVTKPVTLTVTQFGHGINPMSGKEEYGANAHTAIKRSDFGMKTFLPAISDEVQLHLVIEAIRAD